MAAGVQIPGPPASRYGSLGPPDSPRSAARATSGKNSLKWPLIRLLDQVLLCSEVEGKQMGAKTASAGHQPFFFFSYLDRQRLT